MGWRRGQVESQSQMRVDQANEQVVLESGRGREELRAVEARALPLGNVDVPMRVVLQRVQRTRAALLDTS